ncbi:unnamed protein product [Knipowitschia caucasica]
MISPCGSCFLTSSSSSSSSSNSNRLRCDEQLSCSICLEVFTEPVTTPCGHTFCHRCITDYWDSSPQTRCPLCKKRFRQRPALLCNTSFRDVVEQLRSMSLLSPTEEQQAGPGEVPCDICLEPKHKALQTCVECMASFCPVHLEPHQRVASLKKHQLTDPQPHLDRSLCSAHGKMLSLFCNADQSCICVTCTQDNHASHPYTPLEQAFLEEKQSMQRAIAQFTAMEKSQSRDIQKTKLHIRQSQIKKEIDLSEVEKVYTALMDVISKDKERLVQVIEQKYNDASRKPQERVFQLQKKIVEIQLRRAKMEEVVQIDNHLWFLQSKPKLPVLPHNDDPLEQYDPNDENGYGGMVKFAVERMKAIVGEEMDKLLLRFKYPNYDTDVSLQNALQVWTPPKDRFMMIQQNAIDLTLDMYSAHSFLHITDKTVMYNPFIPSQPRPWFFQRHFQNFPFVVSTCGFSSGRFYFEVTVSCAQEWSVGVVRENFNRHKIYEWLPSPSDGAWMLCTLNKGGGLRYFQSVDNWPQKVGVFVDYEKAEVSFYDVNARVLMTSFRECVFNEPVSLLKSALYGLGGATADNTTKLYPVFGVFKCFNSLEITPVDTTF